MSAPAPTSSPQQSPSQDLAQTMGFSAFGAPPNPPKRRKLHQDTEGEGTGGNSIPLGRRRGEEGAGDEGERDEEQFGEVEGDGGDEGDAKQDEETTLENLKTAALERLNNPPHSTLSPKPPSSTPHHTHPAQTPPQPLGHGLASRGAEAAGKEAVDWRALRKGVRDENGDVAYYDGSFVEDPWRGVGCVGEGV